MNPELKTALCGIGLCIAGAILCECRLFVIGTTLLAIGAIALFFSPLIGMLFPKK